MNTYRWTCLACKTPNILAHDETIEGQVGLNCTQCGEPGVFEPDDMRIRVSPGFPGAYVDVISTNMPAMMDSAQGIDYASPKRIAKIPYHWTEEDTATLRALRKENGHDD